MGVFDKLAYLLLERLLKVAESGAQPDVAAWLHELLAGGPEQFQRGLRELVKARSWETCIISTSGTGRFAYRKFAPEPTKRVSLAKPQSPSKRCTW